MFPALFAASPAQYFFGILLFVASTFLVLLVMVQRGRGGGLAGAFGGMGGQSAFGTKAGDLFTRITIGVAAVWLLLCITTIVVLNRQTTNPLGAPDDNPSTLSSPADGDGSKSDADAKAGEGQPTSTGTGDSASGGAGSGGTGTGGTGSDTEAPATGSGGAGGAGSGDADPGSTP
jgi:preprotein translocase subunit SecG